MQSFTIAALERSKQNKSALKGHRKQGLIPAILYGKKSGNQMISIKTPDIQKAFREGLMETSLIEIQSPVIEPNSFFIIKDIQRHPVTQNIIHIDFQAISLDETIVTFIPIELVGSAKGVKDGGILEHGLREIEIEALPRDIPKSIQVDINHLLIGQTIHVEDLKLEKIRVLTDQKAFIVAVSKLRTAEETPVAEVSSAEEPEVIEKGKKPVGDDSDK